MSFVPKLSPSMLDGKDEHHSVTVGDDNSC